MIGSTYRKDSQTNFVGLNCDQGDQVSIGYFNGKVDENGAKQYGSFIRCDHRNIGNDPTDHSKERAIHIAEVPEIYGAWGGQVFIGPSKFHYRGGLLVKVEQGTVATGTFKTGAGETVRVVKGAITEIN